MVLLFSKIKKNIFWILISLFSLSIISFFYNNFLLLKELSIIKFVFLPLFILSLFLFIFFNKKTIKTNWKNLLIFIIIFVLIILSKIIFLINIDGVFNSDDAIIGIMADHMIEGKPASFFYYGQRYLGSGYSLLNVLFILIFGNNFLAIGITSLFFLSLFVFIQYRIVIEFFDKKFIFYIIGFYMFSSGIFIRNIFSIGGNFPLVYLLLALSLYLTLRILLKNEKNLIIILGFIIGVSFWIHQLTIIFGVISIIMILFSNKIKQSFKFLISILIGAFPFVLFEITHGFINTKFSLGIGKNKINIGLDKKIINLYKGIKGLFPLKIEFVFFYVLILVFIILVFIVLKDIKKTKIYSLNFILLVFTISFILFYLGSSFSNVFTSRYFMPLYVLVPLIFISIFIYIFKSKVHFVLIPFFVILFVYGIKENSSIIKNTSDIAIYRNALLKDLKQTRKKNWYFQDYWKSYIISFMSKGRINVSNGSLERFFPYKLDLYSANEQNFLVTSSQGKYIKNKYDYYGIRYKLIKKKLHYIFYDIRSKINYWTINSNRLEAIPNIVFDGADGEYLAFSIKSKNKKNLRLNISIASNLTDTYKHKVKLKNRILIKIPSYFYGKKVKVTAFVDYYGTIIPKSLIRKNLAIKTSTKDKNDIYYLRGFTDVKSKIKGYTHGRGIRWKDPIIIKNGMIIEKKCKLLITKNDISGISLKLKNIIDFNKYIWWRPDYKQVISVEYNNSSKDYTLENDKETIYLNFEKKQSKNMTVSIKTKYILPYVFEGFGYIESGVILEELKLLY